ncbi:MAG TPA: Clp protease N-terminal domain-containing protein [Solirubrobacter sp.]|nr:Clp protease N-terminal domain-containing protein [Solirubrobacter sp.]
MFNRFTGEARMVVNDAVDVAAEVRSPRVEAEHLLLAVTRGSGPVARALHDANLDYEGLRDALRAETTRSLAAVGVTAATPEFSPFVDRPKLATSAKLALERALRVAVARGDKRIGSAHIALGTLRAPTGTVPRALEAAAISRPELITRIERAADDAPPSR